MARSKGGTPNVPAIPKSTSVINYRELMQKQAAEIQNKIGAPGGDKIVVGTDKTFKFPDGRISKDPFKAVIVEFITGHYFYKGKYDPKNIVPPDCFALGTDPKDMFPSENAPDRQAENCQSCPNNQFGSDGDAKACKNQRLLALLPPDADAETPFNVLHVSPTALRAFDGYVAKLASVFGKPPSAFVSEVGFNPGKEFATLVFGNPQPLEEDQLPVFLSRQTEAIKRLLTEPDLTQREARQPAKPARGQAQPARRR